MNLTQNWIPENVKTIHLIAVCGTGHAHPEVVDVIHNNPYAIPTFLRSAKNLTPEQWEKLQKQVEKMSKEK